MSERVAEADSDIPARQNHWQRIRVHPSGADGVLGHEDAEGAPANERRARRVRAGHDNHRPLPGAVQPLPRQLPLSLPAPGRGDCPDQPSEEGAGESAASHRRQAGEPAASGGEAGRAATARGCSHLRKDRRL